MRQQRFLSIITTILTHPGRRFILAGITGLAAGFLIATNSPDSSLASDFASNNDDWAPITTFAGGDRFYLQKSTIKPLGNGRLEYTVVGQPGPSADKNATHPVTRNEVDCSTGQFKSATQTLHQDVQGKTVSQKTGSPYSMTLNKQSQMYKLLNDACQEHAPEVKRSW